jgi:hypothetical protein
MHTQRSKEHGVRGQVEEKKTRQYIIQVRRDVFTQEKI